MQAIQTLPAPLNTYEKHNEGVALNKPVTLPLQDYLFPEGTPYSVSYQGEKREFLSIRTIQVEEGSEGLFVPVYSQTRALDTRFMASWAGRLESKGWSKPLIALSLYNNSSQVTLAALAKHPNLYRLYSGESNSVKVSLHQDIDAATLKEIGCVRTADREPTFLVEDQYKPHGLGFGCATIEAWEAAGCRILSEACMYRGEVFANRIEVINPAKADKLYRGLGLLPPNAFLRPDTYARKARETVSLAQLAELKPSQLDIPQTTEFGYTLTETGEIRVLIACVHLKEVTCILNKTAKVAHLSDLAFQDPIGDYRKPEAYPFFVPTDRLKRNYDLQNAPIWQVGVTRAVNSVYYTTGIAREDIPLLPLKKELRKKLKGQHNQVPPSPELYSTEQLARYATLPNVYPLTKLHQELKQMGFPHAVGQDLLLKWALEKPGMAAYCVAIQNVPERKCSNTFTCFGTLNEIFEHAEAGPILFQMLKRAQPFAISFASLALTNTNVQGHLLVQQL